MNATHHQTPAIVFCVERIRTGEVITASRDQDEARDIGELVAEFEPDDYFELVPHTLH